MSIVMGQITWHEGAPDPHLSYEVIKASKVFRVFRFEAQTLPWTLSSSREARYFLAMTADDSDSLEAGNVVRCSESTPDLDVAVGLFGALIKGALK